MAIVSWIAAQRGTDHRYPTITSPYVDAPITDDEVSPRMMQRLGRYELVRHLASGGMSRVYLARATGPGGFARHVVLKTIPTERQDDEQYVAMFLDEARLVAALNHQHIAQVFEVGCADDGSYFFAMEYVHGETVRHLLETARKQRVKLPLEVGLSIACAAAAGLHHAHERRDASGTPLGIVHRDVSPSNVILGYDGSVKLIDFGIAKATLRTTQTQTGFIKGKAGYMAPEQARGYAVDRRSDVFALGVLAYELTTQTRAYHAESQFESIRRTLRGDIAPPSLRVADYPPALEDVIMTALELDPDDRFQDVDAMRIAFEQIARELGVGLGSTPVIRALERLFPPRPEPWLAGGDGFSEEQVAPELGGSEPMIVVVPRTPTRLRLAKGTETPDLDPVPEPVRTPERAPILDQLETQPYERSVPVRPEHGFASLGAASDSMITPSLLPSALQSPVPLSPVPLAPMPLAPMPMRQTPSPIRQTPVPVRQTPVPVRPTMDLSLHLPLPPTRNTPTPFESAPVIPAPMYEPVEPLRPALRATSTLYVFLDRRRRAFTIGAAAIAVCGLTLLGFAIVRDEHRAAAPPQKSAPAPVVPSAPVPAPAPKPAPVAAPAKAVKDGTVVLDVATVPDGATVVLDGVRLGVSPLSIRLTSRPGPVWLKVRKRGHAAVKTKISLDRDVRWDVELRALAR